MALVELQTVAKFHIFQCKSLAVNVSVSTHHNTSKLHEGREVHADVTRIFKLGLSLFKKGVHWLDIVYFMTCLKETIACQYFPLASFVMSMSTVPESPRIFFINRCFLWLLSCVKKCLVTDLQTRDVGHLLPYHYSFCCVSDVQNFLVWPFTISLWVILDRCAEISRNQWTNSIILLKIFCDFEFKVSLGGNVKIIQATHAPPLARFTDVISWMASIPP